MGIVQELENLIVKCREVERGQTTLESLRNDVGRLALLIAKIGASHSFILQRDLSKLMERLK